MCGLFGWIEGKDHKLKPHEKDKLNLILSWKTETRGKDSFGMLVKAPNDDLAIIKGVGSFKTCRLNRATKKKLRQATMVMGHTRQATHGTVNVKNAHPFECQDLIMAHNGVIASLGKYQKETIIMPQGETDSETILTWVVSKNLGVEGFLDIDSHYESFSVYDKKRKNLFLITKGRPLFYIQGEKVSLYGSEPEIIESTYKMVFKKEIEATEIVPTKVVAVLPSGLSIIKEEIATMQSATSYGAEQWEDYENDKYHRYANSRVIEGEYVNKKDWDKAWKNKD